MPIQNYGAVMGSMQDNVAAPANAFLDARQNAAIERRRNALFNAGMEDRDREIQADQATAQAGQHKAELTQALAKIRWMKQSGNLSAQLKANPQGAAQMSQMLGVDLLSLPEDQVLQQFNQLEGIFASQLGEMPKEAPKAPGPEYRQVGDSLLELPTQAGGQPRVAYTAPQKTQQYAPDKPQLVDITLPDGRTQKQWVYPGQSQGTPIGEPATPRTTKADAARTRKEFRGLQSVKDYETALPLLVSARKAPDTGYGDLQLIYTAGKILDPGSVVREGELQLTIASGSPLQRVLGSTRFSAEQGGRLPPESRRQLLEMLNERVLAYRQAYDRDYQQYAEYASETQMDPRAVVGRHAANAFQGQGAPKQEAAKFEQGKLYTDANGRKAIYMGKGKDGKDIWQAPR